MGKRIVIMAGGTGGHVFPALAVAEKLIEQGWEVSWLGTRTGLEARIVTQRGIDIDWLSVSGFRGKGILARITALFNIAKACFEAWLILRRRKPDVVLGLGGFVAGPGGLMSKLLGIPLVIHEQNRVPGTTNRLLSKWANQVLEAFPGSFSTKVHAQCTGNPLRGDFISRANTLFKPPHDTLNILVLGGSQGAQALNENIPDALSTLTDICVKHQTGSAMQQQVIKRYQALNIDAETHAFIDDMVSAYQWADLVICRAGAMTISELAAMGLPSILIPLPHAIDDHQRINAQFLADAGAALIVEQKNLNAKVLNAMLKQLIATRNVMAEAAAQCARLDATDSVAHYCMTVQTR